MINRYSVKKGLLNLRVDSIDRNKKKCLMFEDADYFSVCELIISSLHCSKQKRIFIRFAVSIIEDTL